MRQFLLVISFLLLACRALSPLPVGEPAPIPELPSATPLAVEYPQFQPTARAAPQDFEVRYHPDGPLFAGDLVSFEVIAPQEADLKDKQVEVRLVSEDRLVGKNGFGGFGIAGRPQATLKWVWDTAPLPPGEYTLSFAVTPAGPAWTETVFLHPAELVPHPEPFAAWETIETDCCILHYITGTDSARDIEELVEDAEQQAESATRRMGVEFTDPIPITLLPRVLGHGGFAGGEIYISYLDRNYAGNDFTQVLHHEMIHILDGRLGGELRPSILVEGLAVYQTRGHFKIEPLLPRAAALIPLGWYIPLERLADNFYQSQHEVGYLQGGALIQFMVREWGWQAFSDFYRDIRPHASGKQSAAMDAALQEHFGLTLQELESRFLVELYRQQLNPDNLEDMRLTVELFDTIRRYQLEFDPSAYFLTAWLPGGEEMREQGLVADYLRRPNQPENMLIESLLVAAEGELRLGNYSQADRILAAIDHVLDVAEFKEPDQVHGN